MATKKPPAPLERKWLTRSISLPVQEALNMEWRDFMAQIRACWRQSTDLANWASQTLARSDVVRTPGMKELPPLAFVDLYALAFGRLKERAAKKEGKGPLPVVLPQVDGPTEWAGGKIAAASLLRAVDRKYRKERGKIVWRRERRTPEYLYPVPFPVHQQAWSVWFDDTKNRHQPVVAVGLPGGRVALRLRNGPEFLREIKVLEQIEAGEVAQQELKICLQNSHAHARLGTDRQAGGGHRQSFRVMLRISCRLEVIDCGQNKVIEAKTGRDPFVTLTDPGVRTWVLHAPWARNWSVEHRKFLNDFADDLKHEKRWPGNKRRNLNQYRERRCEKHARRMKSFLQETAAQVVGWAARQGCGRLLWDDADRSFAEEFPWFKLTECVQNKCDEAGIVLVASAATMKPEEAAEVAE